MAKAILTIDDIPAKVSGPVCSFLHEKHIPFVMFFVGEWAVKSGLEDMAVDIIKSGVTIGNHTYTHPFLSQLSYEEAIEEIEKNESMIENLYKIAGMERKAKIFRFPYIDKGGDNKEKIFKYLRENGFKKIDDRGVQNREYHDKGWDREPDVTFTFDCLEYEISGGGISFETVMDRIQNGDRESNVNLLKDEGVNIILLHTHDHTNEAVPDYYMTMINAMLDGGVEFLEPEYI